MAIKVTKKELHECVYNAVARYVNESKSKNNNTFDTPSKHEKAKKNKLNSKTSKGNKGNQRWFDDDEDMY